MCVTEVLAAMGRFSVFNRPVTNNHYFVHQNVVFLKSYRNIISVTDFNFLFFISDVGDNESRCTVGYIDCVFPVDVGHGSFV